MWQSVFTIYSCFNHLFSILILIQIFDVCSTVYPKQQQQQEQQQYHHHHQQQQPQQESNEQQSQHPEESQQQHILDIMNNIDKLSTFRNYNNSYNLNSTVDIWNKGRGKSDSAYLYHDLFICGPFS